MILGALRRCGGRGVVGGATGPETTDDALRKLACTRLVGSRPSNHYFRSFCWFVCLFVCAEFFSAVFDPISIKLGRMLYVWVYSCVP